MKRNGDVTGMPALEGVLPLDKPVGPSSFFLVRQVRRLTGVARVGHCGTLDPFASGLLVVCVGRPATRLASLLMGGEKEYVATLQLGVETETQDPEGRILRVASVPELTAGCFDRCLAGLRGRRLQQPPRFSALKHQGKPLYYYARRGIEVTKPPREVDISVLDVEGYDPVSQQLAIRVVCSPGTYIRSLAEEIGRELGCGAHLVALRRLRSGSLHVCDAMQGKELADASAACTLPRHLLSLELVRTTACASSFAGDVLEFS